MTTIACNLTNLSTEQRKREQILLWKIRSRPFTETADGVTFQLPADAHSLAEAGEFLAYERLCCPFLRFRLEVTSDEVTLTVSGGEPGAREFILATFGRV